MRKRLALGISIPIVLLFVGLVVALMLPSRLFVVTEALESLGLLGSRERIAGLVAAPSGPEPPPPLLIVNGTIWDAAGGLRPNPGLYLRAGRIAQPSDPGAAAARVVDATGATLLPGLIDMHVHSFGATFEDEMMIGCGVTTVRDLGTYLPGALRLRAQAASGERIAPRRFVAGPYLVGEAPARDHEVGAPDPEAARQVVKDLAEAGADGVKVHHGIGEATLSAVVEEAHARGLWVAAHLDRVGVREAAKIGIDTLEHFSGFYDLSPAGREAALEALLARGTAVTPTLVAVENSFRIRDLARGDNPALAFVPRFMRGPWISSQMFNAEAGSLDEEEIGRRRERLSLMQELSRTFRRAGGRLLAGSDAPAFLVPPGLGLHRELELLVEAGLTPAEALAAATSEAALALGAAGDLGGLAPGMRADLIMVDGEGGPDVSLPSPERLLLVVKDGRVLMDRLD